MNLKKLQKKTAILIVISMGLNSLAIATPKDDDLSAIIKEKGDAWKETQTRFCKAVSSSYRLDMEPKDREEWTNTCLRNAADVEQRWQEAMDQKTTISSTYHHNPGFIPDESEAQKIYRGEIESVQIVIDPDKTKSDEVYMRAFYHPGKKASRGDVFHEICSMNYDDYVPSFIKLEKSHEQIVTRDWPEWVRKGVPAAALALGVGIPIFLNWKWIKIEKNPRAIFRVGGIFARMAASMAVHAKETPKGPKLRPNWFGLTMMLFFIVPKTWDFYKMNQEQFDAFVAREEAERRIEIKEALIATRDFSEYGIPLVEPEQGDLYAKLGKWEDIALQYNDELEQADLDEIEPYLYPSKVQDLNNLEQYLSECPNCISRQSVPRFYDAMIKFCHSKKYRASFTTEASTRDEGVSYEIVD